jgi:hypothetical protein
MHRSQHVVISFAKHASRQSSKKMTDREYSAPSVEAMLIAAVTLPIIAGCKKDTSLDWLELPSPLISFVKTMAVKSQILEWRKEDLRCKIFIFDHFVNL